MTIRPEMALANDLHRIRDCIMNGGGRAVCQPEFDKEALTMLQGAVERCEHYKLEGNLNDIEFILTPFEREKLCYLMDVPNGSNFFLRKEIKRVLWAS